LILLSSLIGIIYSLINIYQYTQEYKTANKRYEQLSNLYEKHKKSNGEKLEKSPVDKKVKQQYLIHEDPLYKINEDYVGWITVDGTNINYPVVLGTNNDFYLNHNFYHESDRVGAIFMDYRNSQNELDRNTIIYGHNMRDKSMFSSLNHFLDGNFNMNNNIRLEFQGKAYIWEIFTAYKTRDTNWMQVNFESDDHYLNFLNDLNVDSKEFLFTQKEANKVKKGFDKIITLATCTSVIRDERVVVQAKLIKEE